MPNKEQRRKPIAWPPMRGDYPHHKPCGQCNKCASGTGIPPSRVGDCWDDYLTAAVEASIARQKAGARNVEGVGEAGDEVDADVVAAILGPADGLSVDAGAVGQLFLGVAPGSASVSDAGSD